MSRGRRINTRVVSDIRTGEILERVGFEHFGPIARAMGVRFPTVATNTFIGPLPANATETVVLTTGPISEPVDNAQVLLFWFWSITAGTSTTAIAARLRRGTTSGGVQVGAASGWLIPVVAASTYTNSGWYFDSPGVVANQQYSLTIVQSADTVAGAWIDGALIAMVL